MAGSRLDNTRAGKAQLAPTPHNRKPGAAHRDKKRANRRGRRSLRASMRKW